MKIIDDILITTSNSSDIPIHLVTKIDIANWLTNQDTHLRTWLSATGFKMEPGSVSIVPNIDGQLQSVVICVQKIDDFWALGGLPSILPNGNYYLATHLESSVILERLTIGWALGAYQFKLSSTPISYPPKLVINPLCNVSTILSYVNSVNLVRDMINTPATDMMPEHIAIITKSLCQEYDADLKQVIGDELLVHNYTTIHAVGRASIHLPQVLDLRWGKSTNPKITIIGKGVCFDSGGLDLKQPGAMRLMKKDMAGAATAIGLAKLIMDAKLPVKLRLLIAAVENAISGNALHPGDVLVSRSGLNIEIHNTDAEGRLIMCDLLTEACSEKPDFICDFATLTGAARIALGTDITAMFCNNKAVASLLLEAAEVEQDPIWQLPLYKPYRTLLNSKIADIANASEQPYAGAITAALFLNEFVLDDIPWAHFDLMAWNMQTSPGRPEGGEAMAMRGVFHYLKQRYM